MGVRKFLLTAATLGLLVGGSAYAADGPLYFGLKAGVMDADADGFDGASNFGVLVGYELRRDTNGSFAVEGEYTRKLTEGDIEIGGAHGDWTIETLAGYGVYRTAGNVYAKGKLGLVREEIKVTGFGNSSIAGKDTSLSAGAGVGVRFSPETELELELTVIEEDVNFLSLGYVTHF